ncbi:MAG TPA: thioredoxin family protein [Firmicutes bacterium]|jgi:small redox-active disulfide protein 2|nr:thioredoxin family protein [Bacillota bacterium]
MVIKILGSCCRNCETLMTNTKTALQELGMDCTVEKVTDFAEIAKHGVMSIPALVIDERVVSSGKILKPKEIAKILEDAIK